MDRRLGCSEDINECKMIQSRRAARTCINLLGGQNYEIV